MANQRQESFHFTLVPAIFTPFSGFPTNGVKPVGRDEKLMRILENLDKQHEAVRRNMMAHVQLEKEKILEEAEMKLCAEGLESVESEVLKVDEIERDGIIARLRKNARRLDGPRKEEDWKVGWGGKGNDGRETGRRDEEMGGMGRDPGARVRELREATNLRLSELIFKAEEELRAYDSHAEKTCEFYRKALKRGVTNEGFAAKGGTDAS